MDVFEFSLKLTGQGALSASANWENRPFWNEGTGRKSRMYQTHRREHVQCPRWLRLCRLSFVRGKRSILRRKIKQDKETISEKLTTNNKCFKCEWNSRSLKKLLAEKPPEWFIDRLGSIADTIKIVLCQEALSKKKGGGEGQARNTHAIFPMTKTYERKLEEVIQPPCLYAFCKNYQ